MIEQPTNENLLVPSTRTLLDAVIVPNQLFGVKSAGSNFTKFKKNNGAKSFSPVANLDDLNESKLDSTIELRTPNYQNSLLTARNGYDRLAVLATQMRENQALLTRGMSCAQSDLACTYHNGTRKILGIFGVDYAVPNLRETVQLQLSHVRQYGTCVNEIISQTNQELKSVHAYVGLLAKEVLKYSALKDKLALTKCDEHSSQSLSDLTIAAMDMKKLEAFVGTHDSRVHSILQKGDSIVADRAIQRKSEYLRHAYAVELLLIGSLTTAKQIAVDAGSYASMLDRLASAYFNLGCNSSQLQNIIGGLHTMQRFTDGMQESVVSGLQRLDKALIDTRTNVGPKIESAVYQMRA